MTSIGHNSFAKDQLKAFVERIERLNEEKQALLDDIATEAALFAATGKVADYIPALAAVDPARFGLALATVDGQVYGSGDWRQPFSIQSVSKAFSLALVLARDGEALWRRVGREPRRRCSIRSTPITSCCSITR